METNQPSLVTFLPATATTPATYQFILSHADWQYLNEFADDLDSGPGGLLYFLEVVTSDAAGHETDESPDAAAYYRCRIWHSDLECELERGRLAPSNFHARLGETQLIPIVHDLIEAFKERQGRMQT